jgi:hypothetical protein
MFWTFKKSFDVDVEKLGYFFKKNLVTLLGAQQISSKCKNPLENTKIFLSHHLLFLVPSCGWIRTPDLRFSR